MRYRQYSIELANYACRVTGVDISAGMLAEAKRKAANLNLAIEWRQADLASLPFSEEFFEACFDGYSS